MVDGIFARNSKTKAINIVQISDLHIVARGCLCYETVPANARLAQAIAHISTLDPRPGAVICVA